MCGHGIGRTVSVDVAAIHCGYNLLFGVSMEVSEHGQNLAINTLINKTVDILNQAAVDCRPYFSTLQ